MTGLEKIVKEIEDEARAEAAATLSKAKARAEEILAEAKATAKAESDKIDAATKQELADVENSRASALGLQRRQRTLQTKQEMLSETLDKALSELYELPEGAYFSLLVKLAANAAQPGEGEMLLSEKDRARLPASFEKDLAAALPEGRKLAIAQATRPIDGGFVLKYGDVEENCSFADMFDARREEFADKVQDILFA